jgi:uncharacterized membrane protein
MKLFGHPVHIMLIHFPSALFPMDFVCAAIGYYTNKPSFTDASFYAMSGGVVLGWLAIIFGTFDLLNVVKNKPGAVKNVLIHGCINTMVIVIYTVLAYKQYKHYPSLEPDGMLILIVKAMTVVLMIAGNFIGGKLILKHRIAVDDEEGKGV